MRQSFIFVAALLIAWPAVAQAPQSMFPSRTPGLSDRVTERVAAQIGALVIENAGLNARNDDLQSQVQILTKRVQELEAAKATGPRPSNP